MNGTMDIPLFRLGLFLLLFIIPIVLFRYLKLRLTRSLLIAVVRMIVQLSLVALYLETLFRWNHPLVNAAWILVMLFVANFSVLEQAGLSFRIFTKYCFSSLLLVGIIVYLAFLIVLEPHVLLQARYTIPLIGMTFGNLLRGNIVALNRFYSDLHKRENEYIQWISIGATRFEAVRPFFRDAVKTALAQQIGTMATLGLVSLPGMMTGQILGGSPPVIAIKYQIMIMTAIFVAVTLSVFFSIRFSMRSAFDGFDRIRTGLLKEE